VSIHKAKESFTDFKLRAIEGIHFVNFCYTKLNKYSTGIIEVQEEWLISVFKILESEFEIDRWEILEGFSYTIRLSSETTFFVLKYYQDVPYSLVIQDNTSAVIMFSSRLGHAA
jgi:hypothetical protein